jgi:Exopolysaccharide biosynthesis protein YbjH
MRKLFVLLPVLAMSLATPALAAPNFFGSTGLFFVPTSDVAAERSYGVHVHGIKDLTLYGANFGLAKSLEAGVTAFDPRHGSTKLFGNAKFQLARETGKSPGIAVGVVDIGDTVDIAGYGIISKGFGRLEAGGHGFSLRGHVGYGTGLYRENVIGGVDLGFSDKLVLIGEFDGHDVNGGGRLSLGRGVRVDLGILRGDFGAGLAYMAGF